MNTNTQPTFGALSNGSYFVFASSDTATVPPPAAGVTWRKIGQNAADAILQPVPCDRDGIDRPEWTGADGIHTVITVRPEAPVLFPRVNSAILSALAQEGPVVARA